MSARGGRGGGGLIVDQSDLLDGGQHLLRIRRFAQDLDMRVLAILNHRQVVTQLLEEMNELGHLVLAQQAHLQGEMRAPLLKERLSILCDQYHGGTHQSGQRENAGKQGKRERIKGFRSEEVVGHPKGSKRAQTGEVAGAPDDAGEIFNSALRRGALKLFLALNGNQALEILFERR